MKRAVIYIRTSSEHQAEKASPEEQEADCRELAEEHGLTVVEVYRDIERYRVGNRLVDPSGTRSDRPGLLAMLRDAAAGQFDTILAWREDRLYRALKVTVLVLEVVEEHKLDILLAHEMFDPVVAPVKAWAAQMELKAMRARMTMGVKARLRQGKANTGQDRYGYERNGEAIEIVEEEARWVRQIFAWYIERVPILEIRRRLIEAGAPQKGSTVPRKIQWARSSIQAVLMSAQVYASGIKIHTRDGEAFEIPVPRILDIETYHKFLEVREANTTNKARSVKRDYLIRGLIYCDCNRKWGARSYASRRRNRKGEWVKRKTLTGLYYCRECHKERIHPDCPRTIGHKKADKFVWSKVCEVLSNPELLLIEAQKPIAELQQQAADVQEDQERLQKELDAITMERQWVITQARKGRITDEDMDYQLGTLTLQELNVKKELMALGEVARLNGLDDWEEVAREYLASLRDGLEELNSTPETKEERLELFEMKRKIILALVEKVLIGKDRKLTVIFRLNVRSLLRPVETNCGQIEMAGTCTRKR